MSTSGRRGCTGLYRVSKLLTLRVTPAFSESCSKALQKRNVQKGTTMWRTPVTTVVIALCAVLISTMMISSTVQAVEPNGFDLNTCSATEPGDTCTITTSPAGNKACVCSSATVENAGAAPKAAQKPIAPSQPAPGKLKQD
jgi:hypothetical protein